MTLTNLRKRSRDEGDGDGFLPISKRLSKLQIESDDKIVSSPEATVTTINQKPFYRGQDSDKLMEPSSGLACPYEPPLTVDQNPAYFESNRVLFEAHKSRLQRQQIRIK